MADASLQALEGAAIKALSAPAEFAVAARGLHDRAWAAKNEFLALYPSLKGPYDNYVNTNGETLAMRSRLLADLLGDLKLQSQRQHASQAVAAAAKTDIACATAILNNTLDNVYVLHAAEYLWPASRGRSYRHCRLASGYVLLGPGSVISRCRLTVLQPADRSRCECEASAGPGPGGRADPPGKMSGATTGPWNCAPDNCTLSP